MDPHIHITYVAAHIALHGLTTDRSSATEKRRKRRRTQRANQRAEAAEDTVHGIVVERPPLNELFVVPTQHMIDTAVRKATLALNANALAVVPCAICEMDFGMEDCQLVSIDSVIQTISDVLKVPNGLHPLLISQYDASDKDSRLKELLLYPPDKNELPELSIANGNFIGVGSEDMQAITRTEEMMIALMLPCGPNQQLRSHTYIVRNTKGPIGNQMMTKLPRNVTGNCCVMFVGPLTESQRSEARLRYDININRVKTALQWLKNHNSLYGNIKDNDDEIDTDVFVESDIHDVNHAQRIDDILSSHNIPQSTSEESSITGQAIRHTIFEKHYGFIAIYFDKMALKEAYQSFHRSESLPESLQDTFKDVDAIKYALSRGEQMFPGSAAAATKARRSLHGIIKRIGTPHIFLTKTMNMDGNISVALVAGVVDPTIIDITNRILFPSNLPLRDISGSHPFSAAAFFDRAVSVFVDTMLGFDMKRGISKPEGGILGYITNFFAAAETTKAGDLHAHFLIWVPRTSHHICHFKSRFTNGELSSTIVQVSRCYCDGSTTSFP
ncbi:hypothetical protein BC829DRAFT_412897 [Chytridium lagenaria]|nr:hypothetical protein BC829DRAFT_412897 [Chytridium lagenaria]